MSPTVRTSSSVVVVVSITFSSFRQKERVAVLQERLGNDTDGVKNITSEADGNERLGKPHVVIVGAGFGGLRAAKALRNTDVDVTLVDRHNFHTFLPLLYEVASAGLEPDEIAQPVRAILRGARNMRFRMAIVQSIDLNAKRVATDAGAIAYDYLIVSAGSTTNFFGMPSIEERALGLKDLREATAVRNRVLR